MVSHNPLGVGVGDWQTRYPVHRVTGENHAFDGEFQVRRAHSDHLQILGEAGWPGLVLWLGFLTILILRCGRAALATGNPEPAFLCAQLVAISAAMCTDFVTEIPYLRFQFFLIVLLAIVSTGSTDPGGGPRPRRFVGTLLVLGPLVAVATGVAIVVAGQKQEKLIQSATSTALVRRADHEDPETAAGLFEQASAIGEGWTDRIGHWKSLFRDELALARAAAETGDLDLARSRAVASLWLYPFNPQAMRFLAAISRDPVEAGLWMAAADQIEAHPADGFSTLPLNWNSIPGRATLMATEPTPAPIQPSTGRDEGDAR
jgi:hypothetical protein